jgi:hypothetical protein
MARRNSENITTHDAENAATVPSASDSIRIDDLTKVWAEHGDFTHLVESLSNDAANANAEGGAVSSGIFRAKRYFFGAGLKLSNFARRLLKHIFGLQIGYCLDCSNRWEDAALLGRPISDLCPKCRKYIRAPIAGSRWDFS